MYEYIHGWLLFGTIFRVTGAFGTYGGYRKAGTSFLKRVSGRIFTINK
jgi:hypothetical protein